MDAWRRRLFEDACTTPSNFTTHQVMQVVVLERAPLLHVCFLLAATLREEGRAWAMAG